MNAQNQKPLPSVGPFKPAQLYDSLPLLSSQSIRVLDLPGITSGSQQSLTGTLRVVDLQNCPVFTALSYVWGGTTSDGKTISCNGCDIPITTSCHEALLSLQQTQGAMTIWVDAICINQAADDEKNTQIPLMGTIYTWARVVYIWLGCGSEATENAMEYLLKASRIGIFPGGVPWFDGNGIKTVGKERFRFGINVAVEIYKNMPIVHWHRSWYMRQDFDLNAMNELLSHDWLNRSWTFQEIALSSNPVIVRGRKQISWSRLQEGLQLIANVYLSPEGTTGFTGHKTSGTILRVSGIRDKLTSSGPFQDWQSLFRVWTSIERPCRWNDTEFRRLPGLSKAAKLLNPMASVDAYSRQLNPRYIWIWTLAGIGSIHFFAIVAFFTLVGLTKDATQVVLAIIGVLVSMKLFFILISKESVKSNLCSHLWTNEAPGRGKRPFLVGLVRAVRERHSSFPKDQVFAVHGVLHQLGVELAPPDYEKPTGLVYRDFFTDLLRWAPSLINLMIDAGSTPPPPGAPSWVPDWNTIPERSWQPSSYVYDFVKEPQWKEGELLVEISGDALSLSGVLVSRAVFCSPPFPQITLGASGKLSPDMEDTLLRALQFLSGWLWAFRNDVAIRDEYESIPRAALKLLSGPNEKPSGAKRASFEKWYRIMCSHCIQLQTETERVTVISQAARDSLDELGRDVEALEYVIKCCNDLSGKRGLFFSDDGHMGSGPEDMAKGDVIAVLKGVAVPMVLRKRDSEPERYQVIGPAFCLHLMNLGREKIESMASDLRTITLI